MIQWHDVFLGVIAVATLLTAVGQIAVMVAAGRMARRLDQTVKQVERDLKQPAGLLGYLSSDRPWEGAHLKQQSDWLDGHLTSLHGQLRPAPAGMPAQTPFASAHARSPAITVWLVPSVTSVSRTALLR